MLVDRLEGAEETPDESVLTLKPDPFTVNTLTHDLQQLRNDIDAYIDRSTKLSKRSCVRRLALSQYEGDCSSDLRLIKSMAVQLYRINQVVGIKDRKDEFIISLMDRIADLELTEIKGNRQLDVCELVSKLSQYLKRLNRKRDD